MYLDCSPVVFAVPVKVCSKCGEAKPATAEYFCLRKTRLFAQCLECRAAYDKAYWQANREKRRTQKKIHYEQHRAEVSARAKEWRDANPEKVKAANKAWYEANRERVAEKNRAYRESNRERISAKGKNRYWAKREYLLAYNREWYKANREYVAEYQKAYNIANRERITERNREYERKRRKTNPEKVREQQRLANHRRRIRKLNNGGSFTADDLVTIRAAQTDKQGRLICWACGKPIKGTPHLDHWIPLDKQGANDPGNLHYMHAKCNLTKQAKHPFELGRLL